MYLCITLQEADENAIFAKWILDSDTKKKCHIEMTCKPEFLMARYFQVLHHLMAFLPSLDPHPALSQAGHKVNTYLSPISG